MHSAQQMELLQNYFLIITALIGLPAVDLYLEKDHRFRYAIMFYIIVGTALIILYSVNNPIFFPADTIAVGATEKQKKQQQT